MFNGVFNTHFREKGNTYEDIEWWDKSRYTQGVSDSETIAPLKDVVSAQYH